MAASRATVAPRRPPRQGRSGRYFGALPHDRQRRGGNRSAPAHFVAPMHDFEPSVAMLDDGGTALHPVSAIDVADAEIVANRGVMDVATDHAVGRVMARGVRERALELADIAHGVLDLQLGPLRQRPIGKAKPPAQRAEKAVDRDRDVVGLASKYLASVAIRLHRLEFKKCPSQRH